MKRWIVGFMLLATPCFAADVIIKEVPVGAEEKVKEMASVAIERFIQGRDVKILEATQTKFETDVDAMRIANGLPKKYEKAVIAEGPDA